MGSENIFINCFGSNQAVAGLKTSNFNALQNTMIGGNFQGCNVGIWVSSGSVPVIQGVGFQLSAKWDIQVDNSANDTITVIGCRTESSKFIRIRNGVHAYIAGCTQAEAGSAGYFLMPDQCPATIERCVSIGGQIKLSGDSRLTVRGSSFGRQDWLSYSTLNSNGSVEIEDVRYAGTPNTSGDRSVFRIAKRRITDAGVFDYQLIPA
jgi:hypothetical protein